ncbi:VapE domain-containing protein [uncultured Paludibaculum sp.]|uniref:VapE domain-containing protein n=1 Tax=uncultured Paludibaculum sp. TaxID=1765020 RepID=UPI002AAB2912|nr:VapE domain-containing protein [uncultured Paludibaculum sp.]
MSSAPEYLSCISSPLTPTDYKALANRWITPALADAASIRRVDSRQGRAMVGRERGDYAGLLLPYSHPAGPTGYYRIRRDVPELEIRTGNKRAEVMKYIGPPERGNRLYFPPGVTVDQAGDVNLPIVITEGEFKTLALSRLASHEATAPRFLPIGLGGVWNWRGVIGKEGGPNGERLTVKGPIRDLDLIQWNGRRVTIAFDADLKEKPQVGHARRMLRDELSARGAHVAFLEWPITEGKGIDDRLASVGPAKVLDSINRLEHLPPAGWKGKLRKTDNGKPKALLCNAVVALTHSDEWRGVLAYDEMAMRPLAVTDPPIEGVERGVHWGDDEAIKVNVWLQEQGVEVGLDIAKLAIAAASKENKIHPLRDYLQALRWDSEPRLDRWLTSYCKVPFSNFASAAGRCWLISAVARILAPGTKVDHVLVMEGAQGAMKSAAFRVLASQRFFCDDLPDLRSKDAPIQLAGKWIVEDGEMEQHTRSEASAVKAFMTRQVDRYRAPFGVVAEDHPRQTVFCATTNDESWAKDETGGRRFWPVKTAATPFDPIDLAAIERDRDQLWAEAVALYQDGAKWWFEDHQIIRDAMEEQAARFNEHPWQEPLQKWLASREDDDLITMDRLLNVLDVPQSQWTQRAKNDVGRCLKALGWEPKQQRTKDGKIRVYRKAE